MSVVKRYITDRDTVTADIHLMERDDNRITYYVDAEWYGIECDEDFDTLEEACEFLESRGFEEVERRRK